MLEVLDGTWLDVTLIKGMWVNGNDKRGYGVVFLIGPNQQVMKGG